MNSFFRIDGPVYNVLMKLWSLLVLNLCILIGSIPIITIGVTISAAYSVCFKLQESNDTRILGNFILSYKQNFKQAIGFSILQTMVFFIVLVDLNYMIHSEQKNVIGLIGVSIVGLILLLSSQYTYGYIARFRDSARSIFMNSMKLFIANFWMSVILSLITLFLFVLVGTSPIAFVFILFISIFIGCSFLIFLKSLLVLSVFKKYELSKER